MTQISPRLTLPLVMPSQAQKHVTVNAGLSRLDAVVQAAVASRAVTDPPDSPAEGEMYIVPAGATGAWSGHEDAFAVFHNGVWEIIPPADGWRVHVRDEDRLLRYLEGWAAVPLPEVTEMLGVNGTPDGTNRLLVQSEGVLFNHAGGHQRTTLNKATSSDDAAHSYQTGYSARALAGLLGSDDYVLKVSADGSTFTDALVADHTSGEVHLPQGVRLGGVGPSHFLSAYEAGNWAPTLGSIASGDLAAATGLTVAYAYHVRIGHLVTVNFGFDLSGVGSGDFTQKSTLHIRGLPFASRNGGGSIDQGCVTGFVYESIGAAQVSLLGGGVAAPDSLYLFVFHTGSNEARLTDRFHVSASYMTDD